MLRFIYIILICIFFITGCSAQKNNQKPQSSQKSSNSAQTNRYTESEKAKNIAKQILKTPGVNRVVVVVSGQTALVGLDVDKNVNTVSNYKSISSQAVKDTDANITKIEVTTDSSMYKRISKLNEDITNGKPLSGVVEEFMGIIRTTKISSILGG